MINIFENSIEKKYSFYELVDGQYQLFIVSNDNKSFGMVKDSCFPQIILPLKYDKLEYYRVDRILARKNELYGFLSAEPTVIDVFYKGLSYSHWEENTVIPLVFDHIMYLGNDEFKVNIGEHFFDMNIEGTVHLQNASVIENCIGSRINKSKEEWYCITKCSENTYSLMNEGIDLNLDEYKIVSRGWNGYNDCTNAAFYGVVNSKGKQIVPSIFENIEILNLSQDNKILFLATFRNIYHEEDENEKEYFLFGEGGECILGGFTDICIPTENTINVYLKDYSIDNGKLECCYNSGNYISLDRNYHLIGIPNAVCSLKGHYFTILDKPFEHIANPFDVSNFLLKLLKLEKTEVPFYVMQYDDSKSNYIEYYDPEYMSIDDPLDAFDGEPEAYNDWLLS